MLGYCALHEMSDSPRRAYLLLPRVPWRYHFKAQSGFVSRERQTGRKAERQQEQGEVQNRKQVRR